MGIEEILKSSHVVAVVGMSSDPTRPSCRVADYLRNHGYKVIPVNPNEKELMGLTVYPNLTAIKEAVDIVDIFRRSEDVLPIVEEAIRIKVKTVWMQERIINEQAADLARLAGLNVVMDKCMRKELMKLHEVVI